MPNENNLLPEHAQLAAVLDNPDAIQRIKEPTEKVQIAAVQKKPELVRLFTNTTEKVQRNRPRSPCIPNTYCQYCSCSKAYPFRS